MAILRNLAMAGAVAFGWRAQAQVAGPLRPYVTCHFDDGLAAVAKEPTPLAASGRTAMTLIGPKQVAIARGERVLFAYPGMDPFVQATIEQLPAKSFTQGKADLVSAFDKQIAAHDDVQRNYGLKPTINGYEAHGLDRKELSGSVQGVYLLIDDANHTVISIDFVNQPAGSPGFSSMDEYTKRRDSFLATYSRCVRANMHATATSAAPKATRPETKKTPARKS